MVSCWQETTKSIKEILSCSQETVQKFQHNENPGRKAAEPSHRLILPIQSKGGADATDSAHKKHK